MTTSDEIQSLKARLKATWTLGDFGKIARYSEQAAQEFVDRHGIVPGMRVLDVACGTGNVSLPAAKAGAAVTGCDIVPSLLEQARMRAQTAGLAVQFEEGDAEALPYPDGAFDLVITQFGAMFAAHATVIKLESEGT